MARYLDTIVFVTLTALVALRPLVSETYEYRTDAIAIATSGVADPTPIRTLAFDCVILVCGLLCVIARAIDPSRGLRRTGLAWGAGLLTVAAVLSCMSAGQKRVAVTASLDWLCYLLLAATLIQVLRTRVRRHVLVTAVLASATVQAFACFEQYAYSFDETWETYQANKEEFWARQGVDLDSRRVEMLEQRMLAREASGTFYHSNVAGSYLVLCGIVGLSLGLGAVRHVGGAAPWVRLASIGGLVAAGGIVAAVYLTGSLGAMLTGVAGLVAVVVLTVIGPRLEARRRTVFMGVWLLATIGVAGVVGVGLTRGSLPGSSLRFRWHYWVNSARMIADHPLTGVGRENFGRHYLAYKPITSAEEISNPHNVLIQAAAEWGLIGVVGVVALLFGASRVLAGLPGDQPTGLSARETAARDRGRSPPWGRAELFLLLVVGTAVAAGRLALCGSEQPAYLYYTGMTTALIWLAAAAIFLVTGHRADRAAAGGAAIGGCGVAVTAFLVHELVNFAIFVPGSATTFFAILAAGVAARARRVDIAGPSPARRPRLAVVAGVIVMTGVAAIAVVPPVRAAGLLRQAERVARDRGGQAALPEVAARFRAAVAADPWDTYAQLVWLGWLRHVTASPAQRAPALTLAESMLAQAVARDPHDTGWRRRQVDFYKERARITGDPADFKRAVDAAHAAMALYPAHPRGLIELATCQKLAAEAAGSGSLAERAVRNYERALALDRRRPAGEILHRFTDKEIADISDAIREVRELLTEMSAS